jgi:hypothetical protein
MSHVHHQSKPSRLSFVSDSDRKFVALSKDNMVATMISLTTVRKKGHIHSESVEGFFPSFSIFFLSFRCFPNRRIRDDGGSMLVIIPYPSRYPSHSSTTFILISSRVVECSYSALDMRANKLAITCPATPFILKSARHGRWCCV